jgi:hypothetical protein
MGRSLVLKSPTECVCVCVCFLECDREASILWRPWPTRSCLAINNCLNCRIPWPHGLRRWSEAACLLGLWVRFPRVAWMSVFYECFVLSGRGFCVGMITRPSYRVLYAWVWMWSPIFRMLCFTKGCCVMKKKEYFLITHKFYNSLGFYEYPYEFSLLLFLHTL